jgi:hypothetical protein
MESKLIWEVDLTKLRRERKGEKEGISRKEGISGKAEKDGRKEGREEGRMERRRARGGNSPGSQQ